MRTVIIGLVLTTGMALGQPAQVQRGKTLFWESPGAGSRCGACHSLEGRGQTIAPDLRRLAGLSPRGIKTAILSTVTEYVVTPKLKSGKAFPAFKGEETDKTIVLWDLTTTPPQARQTDKAEVLGYGSNTAWKHPPASANLTTKQLADVIAYLRFVSKGDTRPVSEDDL